MNKEIYTKNIYILFVGLFLSVTAAILISFFIIRIYVDYTDNVKKERAKGVEFIKRTLRENAEYNRNMKNLTKQEQLLFEKYR